MADAMMDRAIAQSHYREALSQVVEEIAVSIPPSGLIRIVSLTATLGLITPLIVLA